jgi:GH15 family glucan-1,4-alpha-glucosidase
MLTELERQPSRECDSPHCANAAGQVTVKLVSYLPIEKHGVIGDMRSVALVGANGSIDWCCLPFFDSPSVFGEILDDRIGGRFSLAPTAEATTKQIYLPNTNVLVTRFFTDEGNSEVTDFMSVGQEAGGPTRQSSRQIVRIAKAVHGAVPFRMECRPAFDYARQPHQVELSADGQSALFHTLSCQFVLKGHVPLRRDGGGVVAEFTLKAGEETQFAIRHCDGTADKALLDEPLDAQTLLTETVRYWRAWAGASRYHGRWRETVTRSALVLKLLTFRPTGAIVAAPTTSLPEHLGGVRNWDYRYTWVRDAAFTVYALMRLGYTEEAGAFATFMHARAKEEAPDQGPLNVMYGIDGRHELTEVTLDHLAGYRGSKPVRVGNAAVGHLQLDIYGELLDSIYLYDKYGTSLSYDMWQTVERLLDWLIKNWEQPDQGIWEVRGGRQDFTYSKLQCWVALDRGVRLARKRSFPTEGDSWREARNRIYNAIMQQGWNEKLQAFTQHFGSDAMDASALMMPLMLFISPTDPRMLSTLKRIREDLVSDSLVARYRIGEAAPDGLPGNEGSFTICSFWLVEAMARAGMVEEAQLVFEKTLSYANHLGLFSEEIGAKGELLGNFPQALTHLGLISAAHNLDRILG